MFFCGGSFRAKTVQKNDVCKVVEVNNRQFKLFRSLSFRGYDKVSNGKKVLVQPPKVPEGSTTKVFEAVKSVSGFFHVEMLKDNCKQYRIVLNENVIHFFLSHPFQPFRLPIVFIFEEIYSKLKNSSNVISSFQSNSNNKKMVPFCIIGTPNFSTSMVDRY